MKASIIRRLRDQVPIRPLGREEALRIAERQALSFIRLTEIPQAPVPAAAISGLPRIQVERLSPLRWSGATQWSQGRWLVILNGAEPAVRQRFSLAHEFKHILDNRFIHVLYNSVPGDQRPAWIEQVCDYFAGCLLMPRPWVKRAFTSGIQRLPALAEHFGVSQAAMQVRLQQIGLVDPPARCTRARADWSLARLRASGARYHRTPKLALT